MKAEALLRDEDANYLLQLLGEYTTKLRVRAEAAAKLRFASWIAVLISLGLTGIVIALALELSEFSKNQRFGLALATSLVTLGTGALFWRESVRGARSEEDAITGLLLGLERLVRRGSQIEDHGTVDFTQKIALELQLAEAEAVLKQAARAIRNSDFERYGRSLEEKMELAAHRERD
jgi:hypothetical protein